MVDPIGRFAVLFADVSGSTRLYENLGDTEAFQMINECLGLVRTAVEGNGGRVVKTIGDEVMAVFPKADSAADAAIDMQTTVSRRAFSNGGRLTIRVGFNFGPAIEADGDVFGDSVNIAARMVALAKGEQVILSALTAERLTPQFRSRVRHIDSLTVKGKLEDLGICELLWQESEVELTMLNTRPRSLPARIRLRLGTHEIELDTTRPSCTFGRSSQNDFVITGRLASRVHARVERRRDKFVLIDQSSNGTLVAINGEPEVLLRREEMILRGAGRIVFGHAMGTDLGDAADVVKFSDNTISSSTSLPDVDRSPS